MTDGIFLLLILAFFGLSVLLVYGLEKLGEAVMTFYVIGAIAALFLMVYLVIALLKPELF